MKNPVNPSVAITMRGFTLIELLVVICISMILMALLSSALKTARDKARQIACMNNLRQISTALISYVNDHEGWFPRCAPVVTGEDNWCQTLIRKGYLPRPIPTYGSLPLGVLRCPAETRGRTGAYPYKAPDGLNFYQGTDFGLNMCITHDATDCRIVRYDEIPDPANCFLAMDSYVGIEVLYPSWMSFRHSGGANMLFVDAHVSWLAEKSVGYWFAPDRDKRWRWW